MREATENRHSYDSQDREEGKPDKVNQKPSGKLTIALGSRVSQGGLSVLETDQEHEGRAEGDLQGKRSNDFVRKFLDRCAFDLSQEPLFLTELSH